MEERSSGPALDLSLRDHLEPPQPVALHSSAVAPLQVGQPMVALAGIGRAGIGPDIAGCDLTAARARGTRTRTCAQTSPAAATVSAGSAHQGVSSHSTASAINDTMMRHFSGPGAGPADATTMIGFKSTSRRERQ
ncbi:hypothetical protein ABZ801_35315 [Actinomadura sp. NPDC047616]|uniref:hypothetical protein n=1 Tax=Actinomadura sp. NPDC047616 TaxID=3155914 RepID=UPI0033DC3A73